MQTRKKTLKKDIYDEIIEKDPPSYDRNELDNQQKDKVYDADNVFQYGKEDAFKDIKKKDNENSKESKLSSSNSQKDKESKLSSSNSQKELSIKDWVFTLLISAIPIVGFVMLFVWAYNDNPHPVRSKWAKATLIVFLIGLGLWFLIMLLVISSTNSRAYL